MNTFIQQTDGTFIRYFDINGVFYVIEIPEQLWNENKDPIINAIYYWKNEMLEGKTPEFKWGDVKQVECIPTGFTCNLCGKEYESQRSFRYHRSHCPQLSKKQSSKLIQITPEALQEIKEEIREELREEIREELKGNVKDDSCSKEETSKEQTTNIREESPGDNYSHFQESAVHSYNHTHNDNSTNKDCSTHTDNSIHINIRSFGSENPNWLTAELIASVLSDPPSAHERLVREKHFNERFPENSNLRIDTKKGIDKRIQVFEDDWRIRDTLSILKVVIFYIHDILDDFINRTEEDIYDDVTPSPPQEAVDGVGVEGVSGEVQVKEDSYQHLQKQLRRFNDNEYFVRKRERIRHLWEEIEKEVEAGTKQSRLLDIVKTLLLDKHLQDEKRKVPKKKTREGE